jgi:hypothetical protein
MEKPAGPAPGTCLTCRLPLWRWLVVGALATALAPADGFVVARDHLGRWDLQQEQSQLCLINYERGIERMLVSVALSDLRGTKAAWVVPIPSSPDSVSVDIVKGFPTLAGTNIITRAERVVTGQFSRMCLMQLYPALYLPDPNRRAGVDVVYGMGATGSDGVNVHSHKEELGLTTELVTAEHPGAILGYLTAKGVMLPEKVRPVLDKYRADSFSFVVTWISDTGAFMRESLTTQESRIMTPAMGISASFPARRPFFPLVPTSAYGNSEIPIDLFVIGHLTPALYGRLQYPEPGTRVNYCTQRDYDVPAALRSFFNGREHIRQLHYTNVRIRVRSFNLKQDLWFEPGPPRKATCARLLNEYQLLWVPLLFILNSCLASLFAGAIVLGRFRLPLVRQAGFGLWNLLTLAGFAALAYVTEFKERGSAGAGLSAIPPTGAGVGRKILFILLFTVTFQILLACFYMAAKWTIGLW